MTTTKKAMILTELHSRSLNRFEAARLGDHCLNSTVSELRKDGHLIIASDELVPTRFGRDVRVKRYHLVQIARA